MSLELTPKEQQLKLILDTAMLAGQIMLESNAETYRVEDTMDRILNLSQCATTEAFAMTTGIWATLGNENMLPLSAIQRVSQRGTNLGKINKVNTISRQLVSGQMTLDEAYAQLQVVDQAHYSPFTYDLSVIGVAVFFTVILGGGLVDYLITLCSACLLISLLRIKKRLNSSNFVINTLSTTLMASFVSLAAQHLPVPINMDAIIVGSIMPLLPGTIITNSIRDTLRGDYVSGTARAIEAFIIGLSIALGVAIGFYLSGGGIS